MLDKLVRKSAASFSLLGTFIQWDLTYVNTQSSRQRLSYEKRQYQPHLDDKKEVPQFSEPLLYSHTFYLNMHLYLYVKVSIVIMIIV